MAVIAVVVNRLIGKMSPPPDGKPWVIPLEEIVKEIPFFPDRLIGRRVKRMRGIWPRFSNTGKRVFWIGQATRILDTIDWVSGDGSIWVNQIPAPIWTEAQGLLEEKWKEIQPRPPKPKSPEEFTGVMAELWEQLTPEQKEQHLKDMQDRETFFGPGRE